ncbi:ABC transporter permease [Mollicutes bacterium LVI A0039]|nr:ABC transporter permease [Mollicutes bacterium LVI A0039]
MNNFNVLLKYSLKPKMFGKKQVLSFVALMLLPFLLIVIGGNLAMNKFEEEQGLFDLDFADTTYIYPRDELATVVSTGFSDPIFLEDVSDLDSLFAENEEDDQIVIDLTSNTITSNFSISTTDKMQLDSHIQNAKMSAVIGELPVDNQMKLAEANTPMNYESSVDDDNESLLYGLGMLNTVAIYFIMILGFQLLGNEIFEEKNSRAMEVIITNTKPQVHMLVKIISTLIFLVAMIVSLVIGLVAGLLVLAKLKPDSIGMIIDFAIETLTNLSISVDYTLIIFIVLTILTGLFAILLYQIISAVIAAISTSYEDYQKFNGPLIVFLMIPYILSLLDIAAVSKAMVFIPFFTPYFSTKLFLGGDLAIGMFGLCVVIQAVFTYMLFRFLAPIYREGLLNYSTSSFKEIIKRSYKKS